MKEHLPTKGGQQKHLVPEFIPAVDPNYNNRLARLSSVALRDFEVVRLGPLEVDSYPTTNPNKPLVQGTAAGGSGCPVPSQL